MDWSDLTRGLLLASGVMFALVELALLAALARGREEGPSRWVLGIWTLVPALLVAGLLYITGRPEGASAPPAPPGTVTAQSGSQEAP